MLGMGYVKIPSLGKQWFILVIEYKFVAHDVIK